ncbi:MAG: hypothetical protein V1857_07345 [archaeon]
MVLTGTGMGRTQTSQFELEIEAIQEKDFMIMAAPTSAVIEQGDQSTHVIAINAIMGFGSAVELTITGLPSGASGDFNPRTLVPGASSTLTIRIPRTTLVGSYTVTVIAIGGGKTHDVTLGLTVAKSTRSSVLDTILDNVYLMVILFLLVLVIALAVILIKKR